jgi:hypothetical protein
MKHKNIITKHLTEELRGAVTQQNVFLAVCTFICKATARNMYNIKCIVLINIYAFSIAVVMFLASLMCLTFK